MSLSDIDPETDDFVDLGVDSLSEISSSRDYVDLEPDEVRAGATYASTVFKSQHWTCDWCGRDFAVDEGEDVDCPHCPNTGYKKRTPVIRHEA